MKQEDFDKITQTSEYTMALINRMINELKAGDTEKEVYKEVIMIAFHREKTEAALQMMEYCKK